MGFLRYESLPDFFFVVFEGDDDVFEDAELWEDADFLETAAESEVGAFVAAHFCDVFIVEVDVAFAWAEVSGNYIEHRGFTSTVWADEPGDRSFFHGKRAIVYGFETAEGFCNL